MEEKRAMPWIAFIGCVLAVGSLPAVYLLTLILAQSSTEHHVQPLADLAAIVMLIIGIILIYFGFAGRSRVKG